MYTPEAVLPPVSCCSLILETGTDPGNRIVQSNPETLESQESTNVPLSYLNEGKWLPQLPSLMWPGPSVLAFYRHS